MASNGLRLGRRDKFEHVLIQSVTVNNKRVKAHSAGAIRRLGNRLGGRVRDLLSCIDDRTRLTSRPVGPTGFRQRPVIPAKSTADEMRK
jgi:hypothetical protein